MSGGPLQFLIAKQWNGLVSATTSELLGIEGRSLAAHEPLEDVGINIVPARRSRARVWRARTLAARTRSTTAIVVDEVARERASASHQTLERLLAQAATVRGYAPKFNANIDMFFDTSEGTVLAEIKSCNQTNLHSQVRRGVSQLLEYRYVYCAELTAPVSLLLAIETPPSVRRQWLIQYLESIAIVLAWREQTGGRLVTTATIPTALGGLLWPVH
jgi:hypothetical protein